MSHLIKQNTISAYSVIGRYDSVGGEPEEVTQSELTGMINQVTANSQGAFPHQLYNRLNAEFINYLADGNFTITNAGNTPQTWNESNCTADVTATAGEVLAGGKSLKITNTGNVAGYAYNIIGTIDPYWIGKPMRVSFLCRGLSSTSYAAGDITFEIYDQTSSAPVASTVTSIQPGDTIVNTFFIVEEASANVAKTYQVRFRTPVAANGHAISVDNMVVSPNKESYGAAITDWQSYTPTQQNGGATFSELYGKYRRVGDSVQVKIWAKVSVTGGVAQLRLTIPSGLTIDSAKLNKLVNQTEKVGDAFWFSNGSALIELEPYVAGDYTAVAFGRTTTAFSDINGNNLVANDTLSINLSLPIVGWSSNVVSLASDMQKSIVSANRSTAGQVILALATVVFNRTRIDLKSEFNVGTGVFTAKKAGWYRAKYQLSCYTQGTAPTSFQSYISDGSSVRYGTFYTTELYISKYFCASGEGIVYLPIGGNLQLKAESGSQNSVVDWSTPNEDFSYINIEEIQSPFDSVGPISGKNVLEERAINIIVDTATIQAAASNIIYLFNKATAFTATLTTCVGLDGVILKFKNIGAGVVTIDANASETIDGITTTILSQYHSIELIASGGNWYVL